MISRRKLLSSAVAGLSMGVGGCMESIPLESPSGPPKRDRLELEHIRPSGIGRMRAMIVMASDEFEVQSQLLDEGKALAHGSGDFEDEEINEAHEDDEKILEFTDQPSSAADRSPLMKDGSVYEVNEEVVEDEVRPVYEATAVPTDDPAEVEFGELPPIDRETFSRLPGHLERFDSSRSEWYKDPEGVLRYSALVPPERDYEVVDVEGQSVRIETREIDARVETYLYELDKIADSLDDHGEQLLDSYGVPLSDLDEDEREVLEEAIDDIYETNGEGDDGFVELCRRLWDKPEFVTGGDEELSIVRDRYQWLVQYQDDAYLAELELENSYEFMED